MNNLNVVLVTIDALRYDYLGYVRNCPKTKSITPNIDAFAHYSIKFENMFAQGPYTRTSFPAIFTSLYPSMSTTIIDEKIGPGLAPSVTTFPELLRKSGYVTAGFHTNPFLVARFNYNKGFDVFNDRLPPPLTFFGKPFYTPYDYIFRKMVNVIEKHSFIKSKNLDSNYINNQAIAWLKKNYKEKFFLWVHYMDCHGPYLDDGGLFDKAVHGEKLKQEEIFELKKSYKKSIRFADKSFGSLLSRLENMQLLEKTIVILCSDHGDEFNEHGGFSHHDKLYDELLHVPAIIYHPSLSPMRIDSFSTLLDIAPTVLDLLGIERYKEFLGKSWLPTMSGESQDKWDYIISEARLEKDINHISIRTQRYKYIFNEPIQGRELYDVIQDPKESRNIVERYPKIANELESKILLHIKIIDKFRDRIPSAKIEPITTEERELIEERLRSLGYL